MKTDKDAEAALPPGVPRSLSPGRSPKHDQGVSGGVGPGGQIGPDPITRPLQEGKTYARDAAGEDHVGPLGGDASRPTTTDRSDGQA